MSRRDVLDPLSGFLSAAAYAKATHRKYLKAAALFDDWMRAEGRSADTIKELDHQLYAYLHELFIEQFDSAKGRARGKGLATATVYGVVMLVREAARRLVWSAVALKGWNRLQPSISHPPASWPITVAIAVTMMKSGFAREGIAALAAHVSLWRIGEFTSIKRDDISDSGEPTATTRHRGLAVRLKITKTGPNQMSLVGDECAADAAVRTLVRRVIAATASGERLFPFTPDHFRRVWRSTCDALGLSDELVPHSLRHGGATELYCRGYPIESILIRGRWASTKSARHYVQTGRAVQLSLEIPPATAALGAVLAADLSTSFRSALAQWH